MPRPQMRPNHTMKSHKPNKKQRPALLPLCLVLAFQLCLVVLAVGSQSVASDQQPAQPSAASAAVGGAPTGPMMSMGSESSSALESSAALAGDDLMAAESSQSPDAAEHKAFTSGQIPRQDPRELVAASVAPVYAPQPPQVQAAPQQPQSPQQQQQQGAPQMFNMHPQHLANMQQAARLQPQKFNPFMAAALAGNYGPAQQQIAAAAAASMQQHAPHPAHVMHPQQQQQQQHAQMHHPQQMHHHQQIIHHQPHQHLQPAQPRPVGDQVAVQESAIRSNVVPAPNYSAMVDANTIELNEAVPQQQQPQHHHSQPQAQPQAQQQVAASSGSASGSGSGSSQMVAAASGQHPVITSASTAMQEAGANAWPLQAPDIPKIVNLEVKCEKNLMKVSIEFDKIFNGVIFSKGHYSQGQCIHVGQNGGKQQAYFDISINSCGTQGNTQNGLYGMGGNTGSGTYFENTIVIQYDPNVQEVYDHARKLRCTWHDQYEKAVTFRPFPVDMLDIVRADFAGDNVGCWMQIQVGKGPWASEVAGIVKIGQTMTMVLAIKDEENKFDMLVRNCFAHDGKRGPIELVDKSGCITRPKLMSRFTKIKNFGSSATVLSYAHFQAFKFPDSMEVHFQCTIQICRHQCPEQCSAGPNAIGGPTASGEAYGESTISGTFNINGNNGNGNGASASEMSSVHLRKFGSASVNSREKRDLASALTSNGSHPLSRHFGRHFTVNKPLTQTVGLNRVIQVVSTGDLAFAIQQQQQLQQVNGSTGEQQQQQLASEAAPLTRVNLANQICMSSYNFVLSLVILALILLCSCLAAIGLYVRQRSFGQQRAKLLVPASSCSPSPSSTMRHRSQQQQQQQQVPSSQASPSLYAAAATNHLLYARQ